MLPAQEYSEIVNYAPSGWKVNQLEFLEDNEIPNETEYNISSKPCRKSGLESWQKFMK